MDDQNKGDCYLCKSHDFSKREGQVRDNPALDILECKGCGLVFLSNDNHITDDHYENSGMHGNEIPDYEQWLSDNEPDDNRRLDFLIPKIKGKDVLDFGCGIGGFIEKAKGYAKSAAGIELETAFRESFKQRDLDVFQNINTALATDKKWDIVTSFHVIEHLTDPRAMLKELAKLLKDDGEMIIEVPSSNDALLTKFVCEEFQKFTYWSQHLFLFNLETFKNLVDQAGLELIWIKGIQRYSLSNHLYWLSKGKPGGHEVWKDLDSPILNSAYEEKLASLGLTDTIIAGIKLK